MEPYPLLVVPQPVDDFTNGRVLTMDYLEGRKITSLTPLARMEMETDGADLADQLFRAYLDQILVDGFFHADPHPGNISLTPDGRIAMLDLGMVARVPPRLQDLLIKLLVAVSGGQGEEAARLTMDMGTQARRLRRAPRSCAALRTSSSATTTSASASSTRAGSSCSCSGCPVRPACGCRPSWRCSARRCSTSIRSARSLDPEFSPSDAIQRHASAILQSRMRPSKERLFSAALEAREFIEELPGRVNKLLDSTVNGQLTVKVDAFDEKELLRGLQQLANRVTTGLVLAALIIGAAMLTRVETDVKLFGYPAVAIVCFLLASLGGSALLWSIAIGDRRDRQRHRRQQRQTP